MTYTHLTAPTRFVEINGDKLAYLETARLSSHHCFSYSISVAARSTHN